MSRHLPRGAGRIRIRLPFMPLTAGIHHLGAGFSTRDGEWLGYSGNPCDPRAKARHGTAYEGLVVLDASFEPGSR
jgi:hypothetical protein